ncbi:MAG TPA: DNA translocase FtsK 4TM domain-containing protein, partial [Candidatus Binatus sp.]|nr:DNA translocase FtsK 4TM domain-containing protein [Candidatus Binatus sp.]
MTPIARKEKTPVELPAPAAIEEGPVAPSAGIRIARELCALALLAFAAFGAVSLISVDIGGSPNLGGPVGAAIAATLDGFIGYQSYTAMILVAWLAQRVWTGERIITIAREIGGAALLILALASASALWDLHDPKMGGAVGANIATTLNDSLNVAGGMIAVALAFICGLALMLKRAPTELLSGVTGKIRLRSRRDEFEFENSNDFRVPFSLSDADEIDTDADIRNGKPSPLKVRLLEIRDKRDKAAASKPRQKGAYKLPPQSLLDLPPAEHAQVDEGQLERSARVLEQKLADFGVEGRVVEVQPGPVVTMYKFEPGSGIKVSQIVNLADDLSMALRAAAVRIQAPVPGEAVVGIEVPNRKRERVFLREILEADEFSAAQSQLTIALGKDIAGRPVAADLAKMPHLLIAGATGTGKSVSLHTMIASILFNATADDVRLILVDPKMLELSVYENIPHLLVPVVVDPQKAASALLWATQEMEGRYIRMRELGVRNIDGYNHALASGTSLAQLKMAGQSAPASDDPNQPAVGTIEHRKMPKIVIVIDELADLLLSEGKTVERDITRLAQKARAAGIHLILATQRPSVDVITGLIKANLPARISLQVTSRVDS